MIPRCLIDVDADDAAAEAIANFRWFIRRSAEWLAEGDHDLADDLEQEAGVKLWRLDPTRFDVDDEAYLEGAIYKRMQDVLRGRQGKRVRDEAGMQAVMVDGVLDPQP